MRKILGVFEVFLGIFEKTKEKKDRENWNEGTFAKTALLRNRPSVSSRKGTGS